MKLFKEIVGVFDASGIGDPNLYYWEKINGIYYPTKKITEKN